MLLAAGAGSGSLQFRPSHLEPGRYSVIIIAVDAANLHSASFVLGFRITKRRHVR